MMKPNLLDKLQQAVLVCDGAMGTMLYSKGIFINRCFDELNLSQPALVLDIHREYVQAGADIIETNTFGANRFKLQPHGIEDKLYDINAQAAHIARRAAGDQVFVAGAIGPLGLPLEPYGNVTRAEAESAFVEQAQALAESGVDCLILETFSDINEILAGIKAVRNVCDLPIIAQMTFGDDGNTLMGALPAKVVDILSRAGADVVGANCSVGPQMMLEVIEHMAQSASIPISAQPNAGNPRIMGGRYIYLSSPEYHATYARHFIQKGASIVGGCCGTTPAHIRAIANAVRSIQPRQMPHITVTERVSEPSTVEPIPRQQKSRLAARMGAEFVVSVEVVSPFGVNADSAIEGVKLLADFGIDAINIPDGPRASARMSPLALAILIQNNLEIETILHYACRDRNLLGMQSDLLGAYALGLRNILVITGDPPKLGDYPDATAVFDVDSIGLTHIVHHLNQGADIAGNRIGQPTGYFIGVGANPGAIDLELELKRFEQKVKAGAEYVLTQPVFDPNQLQTFLRRTREFKIPVLAGIMPLKSFKTVEFLNNEVPGIQVPPDIADRMKRTPDAKTARLTGIQIAQEALVACRELEGVAGIYLMPPFGKDKFQTAIEVLEILK